MFKDSGPVLWILLFTAIICIAGFGWLWMYWGWYMTIGLLVIGVLYLLFFFRQHIPFSSLRFIRIGSGLWYALGTIVVIYATVFIWNLFAVSINRWPWDIDPASVPRSRISLRSTINDGEQARVRKNSTPTDTRIPLEMNTYQLLKAGTKYRWERACLTEYYFRIKEVGRVGLAYQFDDNSTLHYKGTMIKDTEDARFVPDQGEEEPFVAGTYTVTVDKDALVKFIAIKK